MYIIKPITVTDGMIVLNNIAPSPQPEWDNATAYSVNDEVQVTSNHKVYNCNVANTGQDPTLQETDGNGDLYWIEISTTNDWAVFDGRSRRASTNPSNITVSFAPATVITSIAILNISAETLNVTAVSASAGEVYNQDFTLRQLTDNYIDFYFSEIESISNIVRLNNIPAYADLTITVTATSPTDVTIGEIITGRGVQLGTTNYGTGVGINDYSTKETDAFGDLFVVERQFNSTVDYDVWIDSSRVAYVKRTLAQYRATPLVFIGKPDKEETIVYGFYKNFDAILENFSISTMLLEVEELS